MSDIFISHAEEDSDVALEIALGLEEAGYTTWSFKLDTLVGPLYPEQVARAIGECQAIVLIVSRESLGSNQVTSEIVLAFEGGKHFVPVLRDITDEEFKRRQPTWRHCVGAATSASIPLEGTAGILDRIVDGLKSLGIRPRSKPDAKRIDSIRRSLEKLQMPGILEERRQLPSEVDRRKERAEPPAPTMLRAKFATWAAWDLPRKLLLVAVCLAVVAGIVAAVTLSGTPAPATGRLPDLIVLEDLLFYPADPIAGEQVRFTIEIENVGNATASSARVMLAYEGAEGGQSPTVDVGRIEPGARKKAQVTLTAPVAGCYLWEAVVDPEDDVEESDEYNNNRYWYIEIQ